VLRHKFINRHETPTNSHIQTLIEYGCDDNFCTKKVLWFLESLYGNSDFICQEILNKHLIYIVFSLRSINRIVFLHILRAFWGISVCLRVISWFDPRSFRTKVKFTSGCRCWRCWQLTSSPSGCKISQLLCLFLTKHLLGKVKRSVSWYNRGPSRCCTCRWNFRCDCLLQWLDHFFLIQRLIKWFLFHKGRVLYWFVLLWRWFLE